MARKREDQWAAVIDEIIAGDADAGDVPDLAGLALHRRAGLPDVLIAVAQDGRGWEAPDRAGGWAARRELKNLSFHNLTRLDTRDEERARARILAGLDVGAVETAVELDQAETSTTSAVSTTSAEILPDVAPVQGRTGRPPRGGPIHASSSTTTPGGLLRRTVYFTPAEWSAIVEHAEAEGVTAAAVVRWAVRRMLGQSGGGPS